MNAEGPYDTVRSLEQAPGARPDVGTTLPGPSFTGKYVVDEDLPALLPVNQKLPQLPRLLGSRPLAEKRRIFRLQDELVSHDRRADAHKQGPRVLIVSREELLRQHLEGIESTGKDRFPLV